MSCGLSSLPRTLLFTVTDYVGSSDVGMMASVSASLHSSLNNDKLWARIYNQLYPHHDPLPLMLKLQSFQDKLLVRHAIAQNWKRTRCTTRFVDFPHVMQSLKIYGSNLFAVAGQSIWRFDLQAPSMPAQRFAYCPATVDWIRVESGYLVATSTDEIYVFDLDTQQLLAWHPFQSHRLNVSCVNRDKKCPPTLTIQQSESVPLVQVIHMFTGEVLHQIQLPEPEQLYLCEYPFLYTIVPSSEKQQTILISR